MDSNERFNQLEGLMADMLRRMDQLAGRMDQLAASQEQLAASQVRTNEILDGVVEVLKITDQRFERIEAALLQADQRQQRTEERQEGMLKLMMEQSSNLTAAFRTLENHNGRIQKLEDNQAA
jgi:ABC-type transporter Mla subunit MlaD